MNGWQTVPLAEVAAIERSSVQPEQIEPGTAYIGLEHIENGGRLIGSGLVDAGDLASSKFQFTNQHVLYGKLRPYLGKIVCPEFSGICSTDILPILPGPKIHRRYLFNFLRQPSMVEYAASQAVGVNLPRLSPSELANFQIPLPSLSEQRRIAAILDKADELRGKRSDILAQLAILPRNIFLDLFGDPAANPKGWPVASFGEVGENQDSQRVPIKSSDRDKRKGKYPYYGASGIIDWFDDYIFEGERLLIGEDGANLVARATPVAYIARGKYWVNNHAHVIADNKRANLQFLEQFIELIDLKPHISGTAQPKLNRSNLDRISVPLPPLPLQEEFTRGINAVERLKASHRASLAEMEALFLSLQHRAFRGEL